MLLRYINGHRADGPLPLYKQVMNSVITLNKKAESKERTKALAKGDKQYQNKTESRLKDKGFWIAASVVLHSACRALEKSITTMKVNSSIICSALKSLLPDYKCQDYAFKIPLKQRETNKSHSSLALNPQSHIGCNGNLCLGFTKYRSDASCSGAYMRC